MRCLYLIVVRDFFLFGTILCTPCQLSEDTAAGWTESIVRMIFCCGMTLFVVNDGCTCETLEMEIPCALLRVVYFTWKVPVAHVFFICRVVPIFKFVVSRLPRLLGHPLKHRRSRFRNISIRLRVSSMFLFSVCDERLWGARF